METPLLFCFMCGRSCGEMRHAERAVVFTSAGNYGSTVFDPLDDTRLALAVCDACVVVGKARLVGYRAIEPWPEILYFSADSALYGDPEADLDGPRGPRSAAPSSPGANGPVGPTGGDQ